MANQLEQQELRANAFLPEMEMKIFHEERGKINCACWQCSELRAEREKKKQEFAETSQPKELEQCGECGQMVK